MKMERKHRCCNREKVKRGYWSEKEDETLCIYVRNHNPVIQWNYIPELTGLKRCGKSCRLRWHNNLKPNIKRGNFTAEEIDLVFTLQKYKGNKWAEIARFLPGRTDNEIKNLWNSIQRKKLVSNQTHQSSSSSNHQNSSNDHQNLPTSNPMNPLSILESSNHHHYHPTHTTCNQSANIASLQHLMTNPYTGSFHPNQGLNMPSSTNPNLNQQPLMNQLYTIHSHAPSTMTSHASGSVAVSSPPSFNRQQPTFLMSNITSSLPSIGRMIPTVSLDHRHQTMHPVPNPTFGISSTARNGWLNSSCYNNNNNHQQVMHSVFNSSSEPTPPSWINSNRSSLMNLSVSNDHHVSSPMFNTSSSVQMTSVPTTNAQKYAFPTEGYMKASSSSWVFDDQTNSSKPAPSEDIDINEFFNFDVFDENSSEAQAS